MLCECSFNCPPGSNGQRAVIRTSQRLCSGETSRLYPETTPDLKGLCKARGQEQATLSFLLDVAQ